MRAAFSLGLSGGNNPKGTNIYMKNIKLIAIIPRGIVVNEFD